MRIRIVAACDEDNVIGVNGKLPWKPNQADLLHLHDMTRSSHCVLGYNTFVTLPKNILSHAFSVMVVTHRHTHALSTLVTRSTDLPANFEAVRGLDHAITLAIAANRAYKCDFPVTILGGADVYNQALLYANQIMITRVPGKHDGDKHFPHIPSAFVLDSIAPLDNWKLERYRRLYG